MDNSKCLFCVVYRTRADDENRVTLTPIPGYSDCQNDYINASYIDVSTITTYQDYNYAGTA